MDDYLKKAVVKQILKNQKDIMEALIIILIEKHMGGAVINQMAQRQGETESHIEEVERQG